MQLIRENIGNANRIRAYDEGSVTVNDTVHQSSLIVTREDIVTDWEPEVISELSVAHLERIFELDPEMVIIGSGSQQQFPSRHVLAHAIQSGIGIEVMTTPAACRTYNVLAAEDRRAVVALFMP